MAVLGNNTLGNTFFFRVFIIVFVTVQEHNRVGVLLDGTGFPQIRQNGPLVGTAFHRTAQLTQADHRDIQFLCHDFQGAGNFTHHDHTVFIVLSIAGALHQLQIVDDDEAQVIQSAALGADVRYGNRRIVINSDVRLAQGGACHADFGPLLVRQLSGGELLQFHKAFVCQKTHGQLFPGHFQVEDCHRLFILFRHVHTDIQGKSGFAHGRPGSNQQQVRLVKTVDFGIQIPQAG